MTQKSVSISNPFNQLHCNSQIKATRAFFTPLVQPKLTINQPNDIYEQEADAVAERVMRMPADNHDPFFKPGRLSLSNLQRKCAHCEEEEKKVQMKETNGASGGIVAPSIVRNVISSGGRPLDTGTRN